MLVCTHQGMMPNFQVETAQLSPESIEPLNSDFTPVSTSFPWGSGDAYPTRIIPECRTGETPLLTNGARCALKPNQLSEAGQTFGSVQNISNQLNLSSIKNTNTRTEKAQILRELLNVYTSVKNSEQTIELSAEILPIAQELGERDTELKVLMALGEAYNSTGQYQQALESAKASLGLAQALHNSQAEAVAFLTLARASQSLASPPSDYRKATMAAISGLTTSWKIEDYESEANALARLGSVYDSRQDNRSAVIFAQHGLKVAKENNIPTAAASSLLTLAGVHLQEGKYQKVIESTEEGRDVLQKLQKREEEGTAIVMQGLAYLGQGNIQQSLQLTEQGLAISQEIKSSRVEALALIVSSLGYSQNGKSQKALELINQSRAIAQELKNQDLEGLALEVLGEIHRQAGQKQQAIAAYQEALSISNSFSAFAGLSRLYQESNLLATAIAYYKQAINKNEEQNPRIIAGLPVWLQRSFPQAIQNMLGLGATDVYRSFTHLLLAQTRKLEALQVVELLKGQELREYTGNPRVNNTQQGQPPSLTLTPTEQQIFQEYGGLIRFGNRLAECQRTRCSELEQLLKQREVVTQQYYQTLDQLETAIRNKRATDEAFVDPNQLAQKAQKLVEAQPGTLLIYPLVLDNKIWLMWASKGGIFTSAEVSGVNQTQLEETVTKFRRLLQNRSSNIDELNATSKQLYDWLIKPLEGELKANNIHNLVFALDRSTRYIPMSALYDGEKYLMENYNVSTVLSANLTETPLPTNESLLANRLSGSKTAVANDQNQVLALGVSDAIGEFPPLPNVPLELNAIVRQNKSEKSGIYPGIEYLNRDFNFFTLRDNLPNHHFLHIATHSKFVPGRANQSFLLLGTGEKLAIPEIETWLNLRNVNLAVLSACETALGGKGLDGREIAGVGYYFLKGGAKTVMASLWKVDDYSTRLLMEQFYENLAKGTP
ncbi:CHAT domain-containing protein, partial [Allocoleopsis sp.]|uniref:CHAT domain-containing protein n=1 Tax=Allocoleopsis sp. TaxID=3088169 RepID=UPI002FCFF261